MKLKKMVFNGGPYDGMVLVGTRSFGNEMLFPAGAGWNPGLKAEVLTPQHPRVHRYVCREVCHTVGESNFDKVLMMHYQGLS